MTWARASASKYRSTCNFCRRKNPPRRVFINFPLRRLAPFLEAVDQRIGRAVVAADFLAARQLRQDAVSQLFAQLHAPLIEGEDVQDRALGEDFVLVQRDQAAQAERVISRSRIELVGRLPSNTLNGATCLTCSGFYPAPRTRPLPLPATCRTPALRSGRRSWTAVWRDDRPAGYG